MISSSPDELHLVRALALRKTSARSQKLSCRVFCFFVFLRPAPAVRGRSEARDLIRATAAATQDLSHCTGP